LNPGPDSITVHGFCLQTRERFHQAVGHGTKTALDGSALLSWRSRVSSKQGDNPPFIGNRITVYSQVYFFSIMEGREALFNQVVSRLFLI